MSHTIYAAKFEQTIIHQHVLLRRESQSRIFFNTGRLVPNSDIDGASETIIVCMHVLLARRIFINFGYVDYFQ